jgi:hypothetical protein
MITKEQFEDYESVRTSGVTNMFNVRMVEDLSGLDRDTIKTIMSQYSELKERFEK